MSLAGYLKTMDLAELLQWIALGRKTGALVFSRNKTKNLIYFSNGQIISSKSNEPNKQLGHFLLFQGKLTEAQLQFAMEIHLQTKASLGKILAHEGYVSKEDIEKTLITRTEEVIYDLFLWEDGSFYFAPDGYSETDLTVVHLDVNSIVFEGVRRKDEWARIREVFPNGGTVLALRADADLKSTALTSLQKKLLFLTTLKKTISQITLELHGSEFWVSFELFQLYEKGIVEVKEVRSTPKKIVMDPQRQFERGMELMERKKFAEAISAFREVLRLDPQNCRADEQIELAEKGICENYYKNSIPPEKIPFFLVPETALSDCNLTNQEAFVAYRINGHSDVKSIVMLAPLQEIDILQTIDKLMKMQVIALK